MSQLKKDHFENICRILREITKGNLGYRLRISKNHFNYNLLVKYINLIGEEFKQYRADHHKNSPPLAQMEFDLTKELYIKGVSLNVHGILDRRPGDLLGKPFEVLLDKESAGNWVGLRHHFLHRGNFPLGLPFYFKVNKWLLFSCFCYIFQYQDGSIRVSTYKREQYGMIEGLMEVNRASTLPKEQYFSPIANEKTNQEIRTTTTNEGNQIHIIAQYIEEHLDGSLPNMKTLAHHFTLNEKKLVQGFKAIFNKTPYAYYRNLRLQEAMKLLVTTNLSIDDVIASLGYVSKSNFYHSFKSKFGLTPGSVHRLP